MLLVNEELTNTTRSCNPLGSYLDASSRSEQAYKLHKKRFDNPKHIDRVVEVHEILRNFFGYYPEYKNYRGIGKQAKKPFETIKMNNVGYLLRKKTTNEKNTLLYGPLIAAGGTEEKVTVKSQNGHVIVHIYA